MAKLKLNKYINKTAFQSAMPRALRNSEEEKKKKIQNKKEKKDTTHYNLDKK